MDRLLMTVLVVVGSAGLARATGPLGGDVEGFIPPDKIAFACAKQAAAAGGKAYSSIDKCHMNLTKDRFKGSNATDEGCETSTKAKLRATLNQLFQKGECPPCIEANTATLDDDIEAELDAENGETYCAGSEPLGDDDTGFVPPDSNSFKCELVVHKNLTKLRRCVSKCVEKLAGFGLKGAPFDVAGCQSTDPLRSCLAKYNKTRDRYLSLCPPCMDQTAQDSLAGEVIAETNAGTDLFYCASPSGAFLDLGN
jgi:hypothetical protein